MSEKLHLTGDLHTDAEQLLAPYYEQIDEIARNPQDPSGWEGRNRLHGGMRHPLEGRPLTEAEKKEAEEQQRKMFEQMYEDHSGDWH